MRYTALVILVFLAIAAGYRAWMDMMTIGWQDPEQSQVLLAIPAFIALLCFRREKFEKVCFASSIYGTLLAALGWGLSWYGYLHAVQAAWHIGALLMAIGAVWTVIGNRAMLAALPAIIALAALVPVPNLLRQDIALPLQRMTATGAEFVLVALGFGVERTGMTLFYEDKPVTIEEACNGMRMVFALLLVSFAFVMSMRLNTFTRIMLLGVSPLLAVLCNIVRVVPTVVIYGKYGDTTGDVFHDVSGWAMIVLAALVLLGLIRLLGWAEVPIYADRAPRSIPVPHNIRRRSLPWTVAPASLAILMVIATVQSNSMPSAADAHPYHQSVVDTARQTPTQIEGLETQPIDLPEGSLTLLRPNTARAVQYTDTYSQTTAQFLLIQSRDARDLAGHYPPRCYPNVYGYVEVDRQEKQWVIDGITVNGIEYTFAETSKPGAPRWVVQHFFALPNGETTGELMQMHKHAADFLRRHQGAAQVQLLFREAQASPRQRDKMFTRVISAHAELLQAILGGPENE